MGDEVGGAVPPCFCKGGDGLIAIRMGDPDGADVRMLEALDQFKAHSGRQWWLYAATCKNCEKSWLVAEESRIHDNHYLRELSDQERAKIVEEDEWPTDFLRWEDVIGLGVRLGLTCRFFDPNDLTDTVKELIEDREDITGAEIARLLNLDENVAEHLISRAENTSWSELRPWA